MLLSLVSLLLVLVCGLIRVGWLTLLERLVLGGSQIRIGARKVRIIGILQPLLDGIKLVTKQLILPIGSGKLSLLLPGALTLIAAITLLFSVPRNAWFSGFSSFGLLLLLRISRLPLLIRGLLTNRQYAYLGRLRVIVLTLRYEVVIFPLLVAIFHTHSYIRLGSMFVTTRLMVCGILWICCVIEANRTPFDLAEGESELIRGYHIEHGRMGFTLLFLAEYMGILSFGFLVSRFLFNSRMVVIILLLLSWLILRASLPRVKIDQLLYLCWVHLVSLVGFLLLVIWW